MHIYICIYVSVSLSLSIYIYICIYDNHGTNNTATTSHNTNSIILSIIIKTQ